MSEYKPSNTVATFMQVYANKPVSLMLGPIGSGKTVGMLMTLLQAAMAQAPDQNGVRPTRWAVVRNTRPMLRDSVLKSIRDWISFDDPRVVWHDTAMTLKLEFTLKDHTRVDCEILFRALDDQADAAKLLSVEYTGFWISEFREIPLSLLTDMRSRAGRYPRKTVVPATWFGVIGESNYPIKGSEWHDLIEVQRPNWLQVLKQPSALSVEAENLENLPPDYYNNLLEGATQSWKQAHILCEYPESSDGKAVFGASFSSEQHVSTSNLHPIASVAAAPPVLIGLDQGRSPAALFAQLDGRKRLNVLHEVAATNIGMRAFFTEYVVPILREHYFNLPVVVIIDPAGEAKTQVDDISPAQVIREAGFRVLPAPTNQLSRRLEAVERLFNMPHGILIDHRCRQLIAALAYRYRFKVRNKELQDSAEPEKLHPWSDLADALQYLALSAGGVQYGRVVGSILPSKTHERPKITARAWT